MEKRNIPKWLKNLQENSWELELLISGGAIFTLFQISESFISGLDTFKMMAPMLGTNIIFIIVLITLKILTIGFIAHLCLRAYWLSLVCINYVYPNGINFNKIRRKKPFNIKVQDGQDLQSQITNIDRYCGTVMYLAITSVFVIAGLLFVFVILLLINLIRHELLIDPSLMSFMMVFYMIYLFDFFLFGILRKVPLISYLVYPFFYFYDIISFRKGYQKSLWLFNTNINKIKLVSVYLLYLSLSIFWAYFSIQHSLKWGNLFDQREFVKQLSPNYYLHHKNYMDEWEEHVWGAGISSKIQKTNFMEVFIRYERHYDDLIHETSEIDSLKFFEKLIKIKINNKVISNVNWHPTIKRNNYIGISAFIPLKKYSDGAYTLTISSSVLNPKKENIKWHKRFKKVIPFWIDRDNIEVNIK